MIARRSALWAPAALALLACRTYSDTAHRQMTYEPSTRTVAFQGRLWLTPRTGSYYFASRLDFIGRTSAAVHRGGSTDWYDALWCDTVSRLEYREKYQVLSSTDAGDVLVHTVYPYKPDRGTTIDVLTLRSPIILFPEHPTESFLPPAPPAITQLSDVSVSRAFAVPGGSMVASANYAPSGALQSITIDGLPGVQSTHAPNGLMVATGTSYIDRPDVREAFGLLAHFPVEAYVAGSAPPWSHVPYAPIAQFVYFHYDRGALVRRDRIDSTAQHETRWLTFARTAADSILAAVDSTRTYGR